MISNLRWRKREASEVRGSFHICKQYCYKNIDKTSFIIECENRTHSRRNTLLLRIPTLQGILSGGVSQSSEVAALDGRLAECSSGPATEILRALSFSHESERNSAVGLAFVFLGCLELSKVGRSAALSRNAKSAFAGLVADIQNSCDRRADYAPERISRPV